MIAILEKSLLFRGLNQSQIKHLLGFVDTQIQEYQKNSLVYVEEEVCDSIAIILRGAVELQTIFPSGKVITHMELGVAEVFAEAMIFSTHNQFPVTVQTKTPTTLLLIKKDKLIHGLLHHPILLENFLMLLSNKLYQMNAKVKILSLSTLRKKIAMYLLEESKQKKSTSFEIPLNRKRLSEHLAVERPSLSRELVHMKELGMIDFDQSRFTIVDLEALEDELFK
jgi:CRP-like cAMP-binding protein